jgi:predicted molibdopterin-dependent oxidoreductase YjgC
VKKGILDIAGRGLESVISTFDGEPLAKQDCGDCTRCAEVCPTHAIWKK